MIFKRWKFPSLSCSFIVPRIDSSSEFFFSCLLRTNISRVLWKESCLVIQEKHPGKFLFSHEHNKFSSCRNGIECKNEKLLSKHIRIVNWNRFPFTQAVLDCRCWLATNEKKTQWFRETWREKSFWCGKEIEIDWMRGEGKERKFILITQKCTQTVRVYRMNEDWMRRINNWKCSWGWGRGSWALKWFEAWWKALAAELLRKKFWVKLTKINKTELVIKTLLNWNG